MSSSSKMYDQMLQTLNSYLTQNFAQQQKAAATESPYLTELGTNANKFLGQVNSGDLRNVQTGSFLNLLPLADQQKQFDMMANAHNLGQSALGTPNASLLALNKQNAKDELQNEYSNQFQNAIQQGTANANNTLFGLGQAEQNRTAGAASNISNLMGNEFSAINNKKPGFWTSLLQGAAAAAPGLLAAV